MVSIIYAVNSIVRIAQEPECVGYVLHMSGTEITADYNKGGCRGQGRADGGKKKEGAVPAVLEDVA